MQSEIRTVVLFTINERVWSLQLLSAECTTTSVHFKPNVLLQLLITKQSKINSYGR